MTEFEFHQRIPSQKDNYFIRLTENNIVCLYNYFIEDDEAYTQFVRFYPTTYEKAIDIIHHLMEIIDDEEKLRQYTGEWEVKLH